MFINADSARVFVPVRALYINIIRCKPATLKSKIGHKITKKHS